MIRVIIIMSNSVLSVIAQMLSEFSNLHKQVVSIAVDACDHDVQRIRGVLKDLAEDKP